jgi:hypothetical protein
MGLLDRLRRRLQDHAGVPPDQRQVGVTDIDLAAFRAALRREADRLGRTDRLSLSVFMEHTDYSLAHAHLHDMLLALAAAGDIVHLEQDSFGNARFDVTPMVERLH